MSNGDIKLEQGLIMVFVGFLLTGLVWGCAWVVSRFGIFGVAMILSLPTTFLFGWGITMAAQGVRGNQEERRENKDLRGPIPASTETRRTTVQAAP